MSNPEDREFIAQFGSHNDFPPNWVEITDQEFLKKWFTWGWKCIDYRQMLRPKEVFDAFYDKIEVPSNRRPIVTARLFFYNDTTGLAMTQGYDGKYNPRYFKFGLCMHEHKSSVPEESRMCFHVSVCDDCGMKFSVDSSD